MFRPVILPQGVSGRLYLHSMPGRYESWDAFEAEARRCGITTIVCLVPGDEIQRKSPPYAEAIRRDALPCVRETFPVTDYGVPDAREQFGAFVNRIAGMLQEGRTILIHCGAGIGRTGMFATCVLLALGVSAEDADGAVTTAVSRPEMPAQKELVAWYASTRLRSASRHMSTSP